MNQSTDRATELGRISNTLTRVGLDFRPTLQSPWTYGDDQVLAGAVKCSCCFGQGLASNSDAPADVRQIALNG